MSLAAFRTALRSRPLSVHRLAPSRNYCTNRPSALVSTWKRLWYRPDGTRRSKLKGGIYVIALSTSFLFFRAALSFQEQHETLLFVAKLQQIDSKYSINESSTLSDVMAYILALGDIISLLYPDIRPDYMAQVAEAHQTLSQFWPEHHERVRKILGDMHEIFTRGAGDQLFVEKNAYEVLATLQEFTTEIGKMKEVVRRVQAHQEAQNVEEGRKRNEAEGSDVGN